MLSFMTAAFEDTGSLGPSGLCVWSIVSHTGGLLWPPGIVPLLGANVHCIRTWRSRASSWAELSQCVLWFLTHQECVGNSKKDRKGADPEVSLRSGNARFFYSSDM